jgi:hypothetical protein
MGNAIEQAMKEHIYKKKQTLSLQNLEKLEIIFESLFLTAVKQKNAVLYY